MLFGVGIDIIEVSRIEKEVSNGSSGFKEKIFTDAEIAYCNRKVNAQSYAARFAAKEAFFKATGKGWRDGFKWTDIEVLNDGMGRPYIRTFGETKNFIDENEISNIQVSLSHTKENAMAIVILEKNK